MEQKIFSSASILAQQSGKAEYQLFYTASVSKLIYTTTMIEGFHLQVRKVTKSKGEFTSDMTLIKLVYLAVVV